MVFLPLGTYQRKPSYSLAFRLRRICSTDGAFAIRIDQLKEYLSNRGYPANVIQKQIQKAKDISRSGALQPRQSQKKNEDRVPLVMTYDLSYSSISSTSRSTFLFCTLPNAAKTPSPKLPMVAFRRPININDIVVRSSIRVGYLLLNLLLLQLLSVFPIHDTQYQSN